MEAGTLVWTYESSSGSEDPWILSEILTRSSESLTLKYLGGDDVGKTFTRKRLTTSSSTTTAGGGGGDEDGVKYDGVELANAPLSDADIADGADNDMIALQHLHEPSILHAVSERYFRGEIYTWTGPVLIAVNPFQRLPLYTRVSCLFLVFSFYMILEDDCCVRTVFGSGCLLAKSLIVLECLSLVYGRFGLWMAYGFILFVSRTILCTSLTPQCPLIH